jgi:hypothetical protein
MSGFPWLAAISGGASGASRGLNDVIGVLNKAADDKRSDARYAEERDFRNRQLDAELARAGIFPENEADGQQPPVDKGVLAAGRPNFSAMGAERTAPTSLFEGVQPSLDPSGFSITRRSLDSAASNKPLGSDVATASADLFKDGSARTPLTAVGPSPVRPSHPADQTLELPSSRATSASPLHTALSVAQGATDGAPVVTIGGKRFVVDESRTPEGRRMRAQIQKEEQVRNAKLAERRSILQQLRRSRPQRYGQLSDELIEAAAADDDVFHQVVLPKDDPFELHVRERDYDAAHPLSGEGGHNWQVVQTDDGIQQVDPRTGQTRAVVGPDGQPVRPKQPAAIQQAIAKNRQAIATIDDALTRLQQHPDAVGFLRGRIDAVDQRADPEGVGARAAIADIGSLELHNRSGAAVTVSEWPRLAPFVPRATDSPETVTKKLARLKERIQIETSFLDGSASTATAAPATISKPATPAPTAKRKSAASILAEYGIK